MMEGVDLGMREEADARLPRVEVTALCIAQEESCSEPTSYPSI